MGDKPMRILHLSEYGIFVGRKGDRIVVKHKKNKILEEPAGNVHVVVLSTRGLSASMDFINLALKHNILVVFAAKSGRPLGFLVPFQAGSAIKTRRAQYEAYDTEKGFEIAKAFIYGKLYSQETLLRQLSRRAKARELENFAFLIESMDEIRDLRNKVLEVEYNNSPFKTRMQLISIEARAADLYWECWKRFLPKELLFRGRIKHPDVEEEVDVVNMMLNYGYSILMSETWIAVFKAGLDPWAGFLHADNPRRPGLVFDLMEEFRVPVVDKAVLNLVDKLGLELLNYIEDGRLSKEGRKLVASSVYERLNTFYSFSDRRLPLRAHILLQARRLSLYLRGNTPQYKPFHIR